MVDHVSVPLHDAEIGSAEKAPADGPTGGCRRANEVSWLYAVHVPRVDVGRHVKQRVEAIRERERRAQTQSELPQRQPGPGVARPTVPARL